METKIAFDLNIFKNIFKKNFFFTNKNLKQFFFLNKEKKWVKAFSDDLI